MLLANSSVSGKAATGHVLMYAPTGGFPRILALHPKSLRQIGYLWFSEPIWNSGDRSIGEANLRKGLCPFNGSALRTGPYRPRSCGVRLRGIWTRLCFVFSRMSNTLDPPFRLHSVFSSKSIAPNLEPLFFQNELWKRVRTSHVGASFCVGNGVGIEVLAEPIFVRGVSPFNGSAPRTLQWPARSAPGWRTLRAPHTWLAHLAPASHWHCRFFYGRYISRPARFALYEMNLSDIILTPRYLSRSLSLSGRNAVIYGFMRCSW